MLKTILNFKGVEVLSVNEQKNVMGGTVICTIPWTPLPYYGPCIMDAQIKPVEPICKSTIDGVEFI